MSREKSEKVCITFRLSEEEHEKLKQYSSACGLSTAEFIKADSRHKEIYPH